MLQGATIHSGDFETALAGASRGDFVFADPPYIGTFSCYAGTFGLRDHRRLERVLASLDGAGVRWLVCNSEAPEVRQIWRKWELRQVYCRRNANSDGKGRGEVPELRISNY
jgi:DNA adenine methylase